MDTDQLSELAAATADEDPLIALRAVRAMRVEMERAEAVLVRRALSNGTSGVEIAAALGVTKQAVHKKFGGRRQLGGRS